jgi:SNF2 family DNA or RNA helicase
MSSEKNIEQSSQVNLDSSQREKLTVALKKYLIQIEQKLESSTSNPNPIVQSLLLGLLTASVNSFFGKVISQWPASLGALDGEAIKVIQQALAGDFSSLLGDSHTLSAALKPLKSVMISFMRDFLHDQIVSLRDDKYRIGKNPTFPLLDAVDKRGLGPRIEFSTPPEETHMIPLEHESHTKYKAGGEAIIPPQVVLDNKRRRNHNNEWDKLTHPVNFQQPTATFAALPPNKTQPVSLTQLNVFAGYGELGDMPRYCRVEPYPIHMSGVPMPRTPIMAQRMPAPIMPRPMTGKRIPAPMMPRFMVGGPVPVMSDWSFSDGFLSLEEPEIYSIEIEKPAGMEIDTQIEETTQVMPMPEQVIPGPTLMQGQRIPAHMMAAFGMPAPITSRPMVITTPKPPLEEQKVLATNLYPLMADILIKRLTGFNTSTAKQKNHYLPFIRNISYLRGVYCTFLPFADATKVLHLINETLKKVDIDSEAGDILCQNVKKLFTEFNAFFVGSYAKSGFGSAQNPFQSGQAGSKSFKFKLAGSDFNGKLAAFESEMIELNHANKQTAIKASVVTSGCSEIVIKTLLYNQAQIILDVEAKEQSAEKRYWLVCLIQAPSEGRDISEAPNIAATDSVVRLLLARAKPNNRLDAYFEVSKLNPQSEEYKIAKQLTSKMSKQLQKVLLTGADEDNADRPLAQSISLINQEELQTLVEEMVEHNNQTVQILPIFAVERKTKLQSIATEAKSSRQPVIRQQEEVAHEPVQTPGRKRKAGALELKLPAIIPSLSSKKLKFVPHTLGVKSVDQRGSGQEKESSASSVRHQDLFKYLSLLVEKNVRQITRIGEHVTRNSVQGFNFDKIVKPNLAPLQRQEAAALASYLKTTNLYPHQKEGVKRLVTAYQSNIGLGLFDEMSLGKTIQVGATLKYLFPRTKGPYLVVVPFQVLEKWHQELITKLSFNKRDVLVYHGKTRKALTNNDIKKILLTTPETLLSEIKKPDQTRLKTTIGYLSKYGLQEVGKESLKRWKTVVPQLNKHLKTSPTETKKTKKYNFVRMPSNEELNCLASAYQMNPVNLSRLFSLEFIYQFLVKQGYITKDGAFLKPIESLDELRPLYEAHSALSLSTKELFNRYTALYNGFSLKGLALDEGHHGLTKTETTTFSLLSPIAKNLAARKGLRLVATGTPFQNSIKELWTLFEFLNPASLLSRNEFMAAYENLIINAGNSICKAAGLMAEENMDSFQAALSVSLQSLQKAYNEIKAITAEFHQRQIRRTKDSVAKFQQSGKVEASNHYSFPDRIEQEANWTWSGQQEKLFGQKDEAAIESACRGFAFLNREKVGSKEKQKTTSKRGYPLLTELAKLFDHPILVSEKHHKALFDSQRTLESMNHYLESVLVSDYDSSLNRFIKESGKLDRLKDIIGPLINDPNGRILISTEFIPMAAIIQFCISKLSGNQVTPTVYYGGLDNDQREKVISEFNRAPAEEDQHAKIIIVSQKAGSEGIELYANTVISYNQTWTHSLIEQIKNRALRNGSPHQSVTCISLNGNNPLDKKMAVFVNEKRQWGSLLVDNSPQCSITWFTERVQVLIKTSTLFNQIKVPAEQIDQTIALLVQKLEAEEHLSVANLLEEIAANQFQESNSATRMEENGEKESPRSQPSTSEDAMEIDLVARLRRWQPSPSRTNDLSELLQACAAVGFYRSPQNPPAPPANPTQVSTQMDVDDEEARLLFFGNN